MSEPPRDALRYGMTDHELEAEPQRRYQDDDYAALVDSQTDYEPDDLTLEELGTAALNLPIEFFD